MSKSDSDLDWNVALDPDLGSALNLLAEAGLGSALDLLSGPYFVSDPEPDPHTGPGFISISGLNLNADPDLSSDPNAGLAGSIVTLSNPSSKSVTIRSPPLTVVMVRFEKKKHMARLIVE